MSTRKLVIWITFLAVFAMAARISMDTDTWWHLRAGQWMAEKRAILDADPFSYTRNGQPWHYPGWLVETPMYWIYSLFGPGGMNIWTAAMVTLAFAFVYRTMSADVFTRAFVLVLAATVSGVYWSARPHLVTIVFGAMFYWILEDYRWGRAKRLWWLPLLMIFWVNSHGGFAVGFILMLLFCAGSLERIKFIRGSRPEIAEMITYVRPLILVGLISALAVGLNPSGSEMMLYPMKTVGIGALQDYIQEWQSPDFHQLNVQPFAWMILLSLGIVGASPRKLSWTDFLLAAVFALMGLLAGRNIALFAIVMPAIITRHLVAIYAELADRFNVGALLSEKTSPLASRVNLLLLGLILLAVVLKVGLVVPVAANQEAFEAILPVKAVEHIQEMDYPGRLFNSYNWGGYLLWALPDYPVFVDGRTDLYDDEIIDQWFQAVRAESGWEGVLNRYEINLILIEPGINLDLALEYSANWNEAYRDEMAVVYVRD